MIKTGLYRLDQLSSLRNTRGFFGGTRRISIALYDKIAGIRDGEQWGEQILALFSDGRGAYASPPPRIAATFRRRPSRSAGGIGSEAGKWPGKSG